MKNIKVSEATGATLDWLVAKCEGATDEWRGNGPFLWDTKPCVRVSGHDVAYNPSTNWTLAGPIIEREATRLTPDSGATYVDCVWFAGSANEDGDEFNGEGPTPLIAAMRCYVSSKLGDTVEVPEELT